MKLFFGFFIFILTVNQGFAQPELFKKTKLPPMPILSKTTPSVVLPQQKPENFNFNLKTPPVYNDKFPDPNLPFPRQKSNLATKTVFANPGDIIQKRLNQSDGDGQIPFKTDQYLGDFRSNGKFVRLICRDYGEIDGDMVRIYVNDMVQVHEILLEANYREVKIELTNGFNKIDIQALNEGIYAPNTAEFRLFDDKGQLISANYWNLTLGIKASLIITKE